MAEPFTDLSLDTPSMVEKLKIDRYFPGLVVPFVTPRKEQDGKILFDVHGIDLLR